MVGFAYALKVVWVDGSCMKKYTFYNILVNTVAYIFKYSGDSEPVFAKGDYPILTNI